MAISGSGGKALAEFLGIPYMQEVVANAVAIQRLHPQARCAIELGGQDAKMIFFGDDVAAGDAGLSQGKDLSSRAGLTVSDMRMNGSCAGGTGAFLDEIATLLQIPIEQLDDLAAAGQALYSISGRCGVYAKTDIQPLLNAGAHKQDIALSSFHAVAKQTIGGLAQGLDIKPPIVFEGGPLTFNPSLVGVFAQRLNLSDGDCIVPAHPELMVALGAAFALEGALASEDAAVDLREAQSLMQAAPSQMTDDAMRGEPFFETEAQRDAFLARHALEHTRVHLEPGCTARVYLGIDSGSTTTKIVLLDEDGQLVDDFYASNEGEPLDVARDAFARIQESYRKRDIVLEVLGCGTTGYGEHLFARAFHADFHTVETVAHAWATTRYVPDASFILDIGGQDMKAIWLDEGVVTDILVNEACSSGCGSFLESFAHSLGVDTRQIATAAFRSKSPAVLGSRCTVFMNSSVVTEQRNGKTPDDIMAGLCRSIVENVFTKVIRVANLDRLGPRVVVQGGTFSNDAVLAAFEHYIGREVVRAPYPGLMGAIGAALLAQRHMQQTGARKSSFIGLDAASRLAYTREPGVTCPFCANACSRTVLSFADGTTWVSGNRCERGEVVGDAGDPAVRDAVRAISRAVDSVPDLYAVREQLLFKRYPVQAVCPARNIVLGLPRVLALWDNAPFWTTLLTALGFGVRVSDPSTREMYEDGLPAVASDTVCFPAKLVHGHVRQLVRGGVDRIFIPSVTTVPSENPHASSESMCAVLKGYPIVMRNSDNPLERFGVPFDNPLFHWYSTKDRDAQLAAYFAAEYGIDACDVASALVQADAAQASFRFQLLEAGQAVIDRARASGSFAVVLASRPYHNDKLVNHGLPALFAESGVAAIPADAVPGADEVDLSASRIDIVNNFHARMLSTAVIAAQSDCLEYAQVVSFGCGHDAYLSDEIVRLMHDGGAKAPLVLKVDESDAAGPLRIRIRSFIETVRMRRETDSAPSGPCLGDAYPVKFTRAMRREKVILTPNTSHAFSRMMAAVFSKQGVRSEPMEVGRERAIALGKKYVHNDICFPAQVVIGEALATLESGRYDDCDVAIGMGKYLGDCRLTHYSALLRKALDDAGYAHVPIITNDDADERNLHPGFKMNALSAMRVAMTLPMIDALEALLRRIRPYELVAGQANQAFEDALDQVINGLQAQGVSGLKSGFKRAVRIMARVDYDRSNPRPRVLIVGEYLLNFHPGANHDIEDYLERAGFEVVEAAMTDVIRKTYFYKGAQIAEYGIDKPLSERAWYRIANALFEHAHDVADRIGATHPLYEPACRMPELVQASDKIVHHTFDAGEGVLIPAEIIHQAESGCEAFLILQPFGCLPNHIVGRGIAKRLKELYPRARILPLDYDPDVSFANIENRLQMLVMSVMGDEAAAAERRVRELARPAAAKQELGIPERLAACAEELAVPAVELQAMLAQARERAGWELDRIAQWAMRNAEDTLAHAQQIAAQAAEAAQDVRAEVAAMLGVLDEALSTCEPDGSVFGTAAALARKLGLLADDVERQAQEVARVIEIRQRDAQADSWGRPYPNEEARRDAEELAVEMSDGVEELSRRLIQLKEEADRLSHAA